MTSPAPAPVFVLPAATLIATCFGAGRLPVAPGTWASAIAAVLAWPLVAVFGPAALGLAAALAFAAGWWAAGVHAQAAGVTDPREVVIDEVAGQWIALLFVPRTLAAYAAAFLLFRLFDIYKPWPVNWADRKLPGGFGIMADDILAGLYALAVLAVAQWAWGRL